MGNIFFLRGPPTTTSCTRSSARCAGSSSAWHSSFQLVSGFFKYSKNIFLARVCGGKQCVRRPHFYALLIFPSSSISLPRPASSQPLPPSVAGRGGMSFFLGGLTQNKRGGSRNLVHKQVSFLLSERHGIFFRFCASYAGYSHERSTRWPAQKLRNIMKSLGCQREPCMAESREPPSIKFCTIGLFFSRFPGNLFRPFAPSETCCKYASSCTPGFLLRPDTRKM